MSVYLFFVSQLLTFISSHKTNTDNLFKLNTSITRGHNFKLTKHFARTDVRKNFFSNRVVNYWNDLPSAVVSAPTLDSFKRRLRSLPLVKRTEQQRKKKKEYMDCPTAHIEPCPCRCRTGICLSFIWFYNLLLPNDQSLCG